MGSCQFLVPEVLRKEPIRGHNLVLFSQYPSFIALASFSIQSFFIASQEDQNRVFLAFQKFHEPNRI
jgi:hypothetical protein